MVSSLLSDFLLWEEISGLGLYVYSQILISIECIEKPLKAHPFGTGLEGRFDVESRYQGRTSQKVGILRGSLWRTE